MKYFYVQLGIAAKMPMEFMNEDHLITNIRLIKITGIYQLLNPHHPIVYSVNVFKLLPIIQTAILIITEMWFILQVYYYNFDMYQLMQYFVLIISGVASISKMYYLFRYSKNIWTCI